MSRNPLLIRLTGSMYVGRDSSLGPETCRAGPLREDGTKPTSFLPKVHIQGAPIDNTCLPDPAKVKTVACAKKPFVGLETHACHRRPPFDR